MEFVPWWFGSYMHPSILCSNSGTHYMIYDCKISNREYFHQFFNKPKQIYEENLHDHSMPRERVRHNVMKC